MSTESFRSPRRRRTVNEINMVPFIDVMLVLLIIFMVTAPMLTPGAINVYCNDCFTLAGLVVERVSGMPYHDYVTANILKPLPAWSETMILSSSSFIFSLETCSIRGDFDIIA